MANYSKNFSNADEDKDLAYDLRQHYAKIVGLHFDLVAEARIKNNYPDYFKALEDLYLVVKHKFKDKDVDSRDYKVLKDKAVTIMNRYKNIYFGFSRDPKGIEELSASLREIEGFLWEKTDEANIFGGKYDDEGL